jgi:hypothetical protein
MSFETLRPLGLVKGKAFHTTVIGEGVYKQQGRVILCHLKTFLTT